MKALRHIFCQCIIHKAMFQNASFTNELRTINSNAKMSTTSAVICTGVPRVSCAFIHDFQKAWRELLL